MRAFLEMHHKGLIVPEFFMSGKLFIFVFKENNSPLLFFLFLKWIFLLAWPSLAGVAAAEGLFSHLHLLI